MPQSVAENQTMTEEAHRWAEGLRAVVDRISSRFPRAEPRQRAAAYLQGLLSPLERKNGWQLAEQARDETPYGVQHLHGRTVWSADAVRDDLRAYIVEHLGDLMWLYSSGHRRHGKRSKMASLKPAK